MVVVSVLDMITTHDLYFAKICILLPLYNGLSELDCVNEKRGHTLRKSTFLRSFCSWCLNCLTMVSRDKKDLKDKKIRF